jgi:hypothetical protein
MTGKKKHTIIRVGDPEELLGKNKAIGGSDCDAWNDIVAGQAANSLWFGHNDGDVESINAMKTAALHAMLNCLPNDPIEGMLVAQLIGCHNAAMESYRRAMIAEQPTQGRQMNLSHASKLSRAYCALVETLNRHRGKGPQIVRVEHVTIQAGGQAVVGNVSTGGGCPQKIEGQPHANEVISVGLTDTHEPPLWCQDTPRDSVPVASNEERPVSDARRPKSRCA